ncbi:MAG: glycosyltransferase family 2 protein [Spirochaetota bacterium]|nr:glycosyltransferase family 2 protein [Spirochaetota bacterium]
MQISIIIPVYNTEKYLPKCLESVINQTYKNIEIIIVDDCSSGNCEEIVKSYQEQDDRIIYLEHNVNKGLYVARETGVRHANGTYITHLDSDDWLALDICELGMKALKNNEDAIFFNYIRVETERNISVILYSQTILENHLFDSLIELKRDHWNMWGAFYKRDLALKVYEELQITQHIVMSEDLLFFLPFSYYCKNAVSISPIGYYYTCTNESSATKTVPTVESLTNDLEVYQFVMQTHKCFCEKHKIYTKKLYKIQQKLCQFHLEQMTILQEDKLAMDQLLPKTVEVFGGDTVASFIYDVSMTPNMIFTQRKLYKKIDNFFIKIQNHFCFVFLKKLYQIIKK